MGSQLEASLIGSLSVLVCYGSSRFVMFSCDASSLTASLALQRSSGQAWLIEEGEDSADAVVAASEAMDILAEVFVFAPPCERLCRSVANRYDAGLDALIHDGARL